MQDVATLAVAVVMRLREETCRRTECADGREHGRQEVAVK